VIGGCANDYVYVKGDPINNSDPTGQACWSWGTFVSGIANFAWGTEKVVQGGAIAIAGTTATVTGIGVLPGSLGVAYGGYQIGSGLPKAAKGARQISTSVQTSVPSQSGSGSKPCDVAGNLVQFLWGTIPGGAFFDRHTDWLDKWGSLP
jgi:hypothetical protein